MVSATATTVSRPRLRVNVNEHTMDTTPAPGPCPPSAAPPALDAECDHSNISVFRSSQLEIHVHSASVKMVDRGGYGASRPLPIFTDRDKIQGTGQFTWTQSCARLQVV
ncbi:hypothetical protein EIP91_012398 [Steccherinum ochraceum]|uniref:Uncharacterized protein n=1 Tax=Steccherinum ochraceum TaxID=92696 RepID=A0A4R0RIY4_9APHY|nr:hypothetical protein EIP91_012398 [Steccherinum ochraceum]